MSRPSLFKQFTPIDGIAAIVALIALGGVLWSPKLSHSLARASGAMRPVQVSVDVRNVPTAEPNGLIEAALDHGSTSIIIRNQPAGSLKLKSIKDLRSQLVAVQPDGSVVVATDPNLAANSVLDARFILEGDGTVSKTGVVLAGTKLKIGTPVELEGSTYRINGTVSGVSIQ